MVRCGIVTYGIYPSDEVDHSSLHLVPAMELKSHVVFIKEVEAVRHQLRADICDKEENEGCHHTGRLCGRLLKNLSNIGKVIIRGQYAPIIGRICMDYFMVDVSDIEGVNKGDVVTLLGKDGDCEISVEALAEWSHSFPYELVCTVGKRIPRVYI